MNSISQFLQSDVLAHFGMALIHSLWQIALLAVVLKAFLVGTNQRDARARYWGAMLFLLVAIVIPTTTFFAYTNTSIADASHPQTVVGVLTGDNQPETNNLTEPPIEQSATVGIPVDVASLLDAKRERSLPPIDHREAGGLFIEVVQSSPGSILDRLNSTVVQFSPWVTLSWLLGVLVFSIRPGVGLVQIFRLKTTGLKDVDAKLTKRVKRLAEKIKLRRPVDIATSVLIRVPTVVGFFRPLILLPASSLSGLTAQELEAILLHELAHLKRRDDIFVLVQSLVETLLFFHPAVWWISAVVSRERENCCDDLATDAIGCKSPLASALLSLEVLKNRPAHTLAATGGHVADRVRRLVALEPANPKSGRWLSGLISLSLICLFGIYIGTIDSSAAEKRLVLKPSGPSPEVVEPGRAAPKSLNSVVPDEIRMEIIKKFKSFNDDMLQDSIRKLLANESFVYSREYEPALSEAVSRGGKKWQGFLAEQLQKLNETEFVSGPEDRPHKQDGKLINVHLFTALRRVQGRPDPLEIIVQPFDKQDLTPLSLSKIAVSIRNRDDQDIGIQIGGNYRSGRQTRWRVSLQDQNGYSGSTNTTIGIGGGLSTRRVLKPGETWDTELITNHMIEVDRFGRFMFEVLYSDTESILVEQGLSGLIVFRSEPIELDIKAVRIKTDQQRAEAIDRLLNEIAPDQLPHILRGAYGRWAYDFLEPESPQAQLLQIGIPSIPRIVTRLKTAVTKEQRAQLIAILYSITGQKDPRYVKALGEYKFLNDSYGMKNSVQVHQHSGQANFGSIDPKVQEQFVESWTRWLDQVVVSGTEDDEHEENLAAYIKLKKSLGRDHTNKWVVIAGGEAEVIENADSLESALAGASPKAQSAQFRFVFRFGIDDRDSELTMSSWNSGSPTWWQLGRTFQRDQEITTAAASGWYRGKKHLATPDGLGQFRLGTPGKEATLLRKGVISGVHEQPLTVTESDARALGLDRLAVPGRVKLTGYAESACRQAYCRITIPELEIDTHVVAVIIPDSIVAGDPPRDVAEQDANLIADPNYKKFQQGNYVLHGRVVGYKSLGQSQPGSASEPLYFHKFEFRPGNQFYGGYVETVDAERRKAGLEGSWSVTALIALPQQTLDDSVTKHDRECIFVLEPMRAGAMAGTIPVRLLHVTAATPEMLKIAKHASSRRAALTTRQSSNAGSANTVHVNVDGQTVLAEVSPDQSKILFSRMENRNKEIFVALRDGSNATQLTRNRHLDYSPNWSPDGERIVFCSTRDGSYQIFEMDVDGKNVKQLSRAPLGARHPSYSPTGWLSYQHMHEQKGKSQPSDLILTKGDDRIEAVKNVDITDYGWSEDGKTLCIGTHGEILFFDLESRSLTTIKTHEKDKRLYAHGLYEITWSPDHSKVAGRIRFLGGRDMIAGGTEEDWYMYGDKELFIISKDGSFEAIADDEIANSKEPWITLRFDDEQPK